MNQADIKELLSKLGKRTIKMIERMPDDSYEMQCGSCGEVFIVDPVCEENIAITKGENRVVAVCPKCGNGRPK